eukprot:CAMPEP_0172741820 /NCGR_PEP_ID=MMETSP1074-20121228/128104_1 /TAXON_ID=2916 /ORGANISM="Ceratium fusus, Strain PA161109" /LENGTH=508 /DNA_ID=CAMNT_0013572223 /DNA_START=65 /DNA_END=1591 /DNA_ORIENTATION=-
MTTIVGAARRRLLVLVSLVVGAVTAVRPLDQQSPTGTGHVGSALLLTPRADPLPATADASLLVEIFNEGKFHHRAACGMNGSLRDVPNMHPASEWKQLLCLIAVFYAVFFSVFLLCWVVVRRWTAALQSLKAVAQLYARRPTTSVMAVAALSGLADCMAQTLPAYWSVSVVKQGFWDWRCTVAVSGSSALVQGCFVAAVYERIDSRLGGAPASFTFSFATQKMLKQQLAFLGLCLPAVVLGLAMLSGFAYRSLVEAQDRCAAAAILAVPRNFVTSLVSAAKHWPRCYAASGIFWPPGQVINFILVQRWQPSFRTTWDAGMVFFWNTYLMVGCSLFQSCSEPPALGLVLSSHASESDPSVAPAADCSRVSIAALFEALRQLLLYSAQGLWQGLVYALGMLWSATCKILMFIYLNICWVLAAMWYCLLYVLLSLFILVRLLLFLPLRLLFWLSDAIFSMLDKGKNLMRLWFLPDLAPIFTSCPYCFLWPADGQWPGKVLGSPPANAAFVA